ncbi:hypothetical protein V8G54_013761 [Vigna mungo]|uniref:Uncharacterized protein n=1 Tax=Vigna mungo TaxID=3915 RepID=A0AAQ3NHT3_VIGMU
MLCTLWFPHTRYMYSAAAATNKQLTTQIFTKDKESDLFLLPLSPFKPGSEWLGKARDEVFMKDEYESISAFVKAGFKELFAIWKWRSNTMAADMSSLRATIPASLHSPSSSAPVNSSVSSASLLRSTS